MSNMFHKIIMVGVTVWCMVLQPVVGLQTQAAMVVSDDVACDDQGSFLRRSTLAAKNISDDAGDAIGKLSSQIANDPMLREKALMQGLIEDWVEQLDEEQAERILSGINVVPFEHRIKGQNPEYARGVNGLIQARSKALRKRTNIKRYIDHGDYFTWVINLISKVSKGNVLDKSLIGYFEYVKNSAYDGREKDKLLDLALRLMQDKIWQRELVDLQSSLLERYEKSSLGSLKYFTYDLKAYGWTAGARAKYASDGRAKDFPGLTIVNWFDTSSEHYRALCEVTDELKADIADAGLADTCSFLPYDTFHITLYDIVTWPNATQQESVPQIVAEVYEELRGELSAVRMRIENISICAGTSIVAWCYPEDEEGLETLYLLRERLREKLVPVLGPEGVALAEDLVGHVTLAYLTNDIPADRYTKFKEIFRKYDGRFIADFTVGSAELRWFDSMEKWNDPQAALALDKAEQESLDLRLIDTGTMMSAEPWSTFVISSEGSNVRDAAQGQGICVEEETNSVIYRGPLARKFLDNTEEFTHETQIMVFKGTVVDVVADGETFSLKEPGAVLIKAQTKARVTIKQGEVLVITTEKAPAWYEFYGPRAKAHKALFKDLGGYNRSGLAWEKKGILIYTDDKRINMWDKSKTMESIIDSVTYGGKDGPAIVGPIRFHSEDEAMNRPLTPFRQLRPAESLHVHPQLEIDQRLTEIYYIAQGTAALLFVERGVPHVLFLQAGDMAVVESSTIHEVLVVGSGAYEHVAVQVPSTFHYGFRFRHSIERERFAFDKLSDQDLCNAYVFVQEHLHSSGIRSFPMYQAVASLRSHLSELDLMMVLQVAEEEKALSAA